MWFLSETTKLEANWLFLDHEVVSDTMLIDYLNQTFYGFIKAFNLQLVRLAIMAKALNRKAITCSQEKN